MCIDLGDITNKIREEDRVKPYTRRNDPILIKVIEELGEEANGDGCSIRIIEIPDDMNWRIGEKYRDSGSFDFSDTLTIW